MNHKRPIWPTAALNSTHQSAHQMLPKVRLAKWPEADCKEQMERPLRKRLNPTSIPRGTQSRMTRAMLMRAARHIN